MLQMVTTILKKETSPENNVRKLQSISKDWIMPTSLEQREILKALVLAEYTFRLVMCHDKQGKQGYLHRHRRNGKGNLSR